jgi:hypothetical protein
MNLEQLNPIDFFLAAYFFQLENLLNQEKKGLAKVKFQSEEANTDEYFKAFVANIITKNNSISTLEIENVIINNNRFEIKELQEFKIIEVILPNELSIEQKQQSAKEKDGIYTNPDILIKIENGENIYFQTIEVKSTKVNAISGSSIQQVKPYEWVIFIKRNQKIEITTGFYINSITEKLPFPDRSPRPQVAFNTLSKWNQTNRIIENENLIYNIDKESEATKIKLLNSWQNFLTDEWLDVIKSENVNKNEKWFNNAIRLFAMKFSDYTETLDEKELNDLYERLKKLTQ